MSRLVPVALTLLLICGSAARAEDPAPGDLRAKIDDIKGKIFDARMAEKMFAGGLKYCADLDGRSFYYQIRNRILNLEEYFNSLESLAKAQAFNPATHRPWSLEDAKTRWEEVKKQAQEDKEKCELVKSLPALEKKLQELEQTAAASQKPDFLRKTRQVDKSRRVKCRRSGGCRRGQDINAA